MLRVHRCSVEYVQHPFTGRRFLEHSPLTYSALRQADVGAADSVVLCGLEAAGGDVQLVASVLQLQTIAAKSSRWGRQCNAQMDSRQLGTQHRTSPFVGAPGTLRWLCPVWLNTIASRALQAHAPERGVHLARPEHGPGAGPGDCCPSRQPAACVSGPADTGRAAERHAHSGGQPCAVAPLPCCCDLLL